VNNKNQFLTGVATGAGGAATLGTPTGRSVLGAIIRGAGTGALAAASSAIPTLAGHLLLSFLGGKQIADSTSGKGVTGVGVADVPIDIARGAAIASASGDEAAKGLVQGGTRRLIDSITNFSGDISPSTRISAGLRATPASGFVKDPMLFLRGGTNLATGAVKGLGMDVAGTQLGAGVLDVIGGVISMVGDEETGDKFHEVADMAREDPLGSVGTVVSMFGELDKGLDRVEQGNLDRATPSGQAIKPGTPAYVETEDGLKRVGDVVIQEGTSARDRAKFTHDAFSQDAKIDYERKKAETDNPLSLAANRAVYEGREAAADVASGIVYVGSGALQTPGKVLSWLRGD